MSNPTAGLPVNHWSLKAVTTPNTCWENGATYDPNTRRVVWFGGHIGHLYPQSNYTFLFDAGRERFFEAQPLLRPQRRCLVFIAYVDSIGRCITAPHGGPSHGSIPQGGFDADYKQVVRQTIITPALYDAADDSWENCRPLPPGWSKQNFAPIAYEPNSDAVVYVADEKLALFCPRTNRLHLRALPEPLHYRIGYGIAADPVRGLVVLFGGGRRRWATPEAGGYEKNVRNDTWLYDVARDQWKECQPKVRPPRGVPGIDSLVLPMLYHDASDSVLLLQNGTDQHTGPERWTPAELWSFDVAAEQWTRLPTGGDSPAFVGIMTYLRDDDLLVLFGGGRDGLCAENPGGPVKVRPAHSRQVRACRVRIKGRRPAPPPSPARIKVETFSRQPKASASAGIRITWDAEEGVSYDVFRAQADPFPGPWEKINAKPVSDGGYVLRRVEPGQVYAFQVAPAGSPRRSLPAFNQPFRPSGLLVSVESADKVVLTWKPNAEPDVIGYKVYRARGAEIEKAAEKVSAFCLTARPIKGATYTDDNPGLGDGVVRTYWVTAVNRGGLESGASPLGYTVPDAPFALDVPEGLGPSNIDGEKLTYLVAWQWPAEVKVAGFNVYHGTEVINTYYYQGAWEHGRFERFFEKQNAQPITERQFVYWIPKYNPHDHFFVVRAVNVLGQEGFYSDIVSPTDRRFRP